MPTLADLLTVESSASIFYSYARELELGTQFSAADARLTLLVPTDKAVIALPRKPHQGPEPANGEIQISEEEFAVRSKNNVDHWVRAHIIPQSPISLTDVTYGTIFDGKAVSFTTDPCTKTDALEWQRVLVDNQTHILSMKKAANGVLYLIDGTITVDVYS
ncbi:hypothetical protein FISHEDRAFT_35930 [Fistulina hepatica ATCC 64428]|uniref:FAS1 domain-containing protein n=1 Tax=Fistulina hepatica ATCC 64428 TaxID=1128425 RepID=A0A0D7AMR3_9AGAR|nr:hypothetical protein FISHEDRAFT_35930 [Fistulina hepatica ATCC 64428]